MRHTLFFLLVSLSFVPLTSSAHTTEHTSAENIGEPPKQHEEWGGSIGALWMHYPLDCAVWEEQGKRTLHCHRDGDTVNLTINQSPDPLLSVQGMILGKSTQAHALKNEDTLAISGTYGDQAYSLPLTIGGTAQDFTFVGTYDNTPFQGKGSYYPDSLSVSLSFTKAFPITGTLDIHRSDTPSSSPSGLREFSPSSETGITLDTSGSTSALPVLPLLSSGTIEGATQHVVEQVQESGQTLTKFSRVLTLVFQAIFAVLVILVLITFGFLLRRLKSQQVKPPPSASPAPQNTLPRKGPSSPHH